MPTEIPSASAMSRIPSPPKWRRTTAARWRGASRPMASPSHSADTTASSGPATAPVSAPAGPDLSRANRRRPERTATTYTHVAGRCIWPTRAHWRRAFSNAPWAASSARTRLSNTNVSDRTTGRVGLGEERIEVGHPTHRVPRRRKGSPATERFQTTDGGSRMRLCPCGVLRPLLPGTSPASRRVHLPEGARSLGPIIGSGAPVMRPPAGRAAERRSLPAAFSRVQIFTRSEGLEPPTF